MPNVVNVYEDIWDVVDDKLELAYQEVKKESVSRGRIQDLKWKDLILKIRPSDKNGLSVHVATNTTTEMMAKQAVELARRLGMTIAVNFNDCALMVTMGMTWNIIWNKYWDLVRILEVKGE